MPTELISCDWLMAKIAEFANEMEANNYSDIPGWNDCFIAETDSSVLLDFPGSAKPSDRRIWFPFKHLRKAEDGKSVYASNWILEQKGLG